MERMEGSPVKSKGISVWFSSFVRILCHVMVVAIALLSMRLWSATASTQSTSSPLLQRPTRPPPSEPTPKPSEPGPSGPSQPGPQPPTPTPTPLPPTPTPTPLPTVDLTFEELGYSTFQLPESGSSWIDLYLPLKLIPSSDGSYLDLNISHTSLEPDKSPVISLTMNSVPLAAIPLSQGNVELTSYRFGLENTPLTSGRNQLNIALDTATVCDTRGTGFDVIVYNDSLFHLEYLPTLYSADLALYPIPFFERSFEQTTVYVVLPENPSTTDLSAAATIAAGLGRFSDGEVRLISALDTQISDDVRDNHHLIVIGKKGTNQLLDGLDLPLYLDDPALVDEQGVIQELLSPWNPQHMILVITGGSDEGLSKASLALSREANRLDMQGAVAIVEAVSPPAPAENHQPNVDSTLADLGYEDEIVYGTMPHTLDYQFYMPLDFEVTGETRFTLYFGHASVANLANSSLSIQFNDVPMDSVPLDTSNASEGILEVPLPFWLIRPGLNEIRISVEMNLDGEDKCLFWDAKHLWATIYSRSRFHLPFTPQEVEPSLELLPYPFNERPSLNGLLLILPDRPRQLDYDLTLELAGGLGAADQGDLLALDVITAGLVTQENRQDKDLILVGRPSVHSLIAELNDSLPQPFEPGSDLFRPQIGSAISVQDPAHDIGLIEELAAPWDPERTILVLTGTTDQGVALASTTLFSEADALAGNVALVEEGVGIQTFDTRSQLSMQGSGAATPEANQILLIQLAERWW